MRRTSSFPFRRLCPAFALLALTVCASPPLLHAADVESGIALVVVFDTSGSMNSPVAAKSPNGNRDSKFRAAQRAFGLVIDRLEAFTKSPAAKPLSVGVTVFKKQDAAVALPLAPFDAAALRRWLANVRADSATPLGNALFLAGQELLAAPAASRHLLILTDGANTAGRSPESALAQLNRA
eukprot:gene15978-20413_t